MINRYFYKSTIHTFLNDSFDSIFGALSRKDEGNTVGDQKDAWSEEIVTIKRCYNLGKTRMEKLFLNIPYLA